MCAVPVEKPRLMTVAEFLEWDGDQTDILFDLVGGEPVAQARPSADHSLIAANIVRLAGNALESRPPCRVMVEAPVFKAFNHLTARGADILITCEPAPSGRKVHPTVVFEVMSPSNRAETMAKVLFYATIDSVEEIVLVESERVAAIVYRRSMGDGWADDPAEVLVGMDSVLKLTSLGIELPFTGIYSYVNV